MGLIRFVAIVEGEGEVAAINNLIARVIGEYSPELQVAFANPIQKSKTQLIPKKGLLNETEWEDAITLASQRVGDRGAILILLDADYECPKEMGPKISELVTRIRPERQIGIVLANTEYESWFVAAIESLSGKHGLKEYLKFQDASKNAGKSWIKNQMLKDEKYQETRNQLKMTREFDMQLARSRSDSFDKFYREVTRLIDTLI